MKQVQSQMLSRRTLLGAVAATGMVGLRSAGAAAPTSVPFMFCAPLDGFRSSLSISPFTEAVLKKVYLTDGTFSAHTVPEVQQLYMRHGATEVYARIATCNVAPQGKVAEHGLLRGLERARQAKALGLPFNPELGLWAYYGDGGHYQQPPDFTDFPEIYLPGPWLTLTMDQMRAALRQYGALAARKILATGVRVNVWDIGNEVESGIAGVTVRPLVGGEHYAPPDRIDPQIGKMSIADLVKMPEKDRVDWCSKHLWPYTGQLLAAAAEGIRSVVPNALTNTHISPIGIKTTAIALNFYKICEAAGFHSHQFGFSFYSGSSGSLAGTPDMFALLKETTTELKRRYGRASFIAEGGVASSTMPPPYAFNKPIKGYPISLQGQYAFNRDLIAWGASSGCLMGYRPWAPDLCMTTAQSAGWAPMSWFMAKDGVATAKPVIKAFEDALPSIWVSVAAVGDEPVVRVKAAKASPRVVEIELKDGGGRTVAQASAKGVGHNWSTLRLGTRPLTAKGGYDLIVRADGVEVSRHIQTV